MNNGPWLKKLLPCSQKALVIQFVLGLEIIAHPPDLRLVALLIEVAAYQLEAQVHQVGVEHIGLAVIANFRQFAGLIGVPHLRTVHAELSAEPEYLRDVIEARG